MPRLLAAGSAAATLTDTNLFVAAVKSGQTRSTDLLVKLIEGPWDLVADEILISEYERYSRKFGAHAFFQLIRRKVVVIEQSEEISSIANHSSHQDLVQM